MMSKRRRASSVTSHGADGDESDTASEVSTPAPPPSGRKKKRLDPGEICQQLYDTIRSFKKEDGSLLCDAFIRAPKRRQEPQYYDVVSQPIDLLRVQQKLKTDTYEDIEELTSDIELLVNNAKAFYKSDTTEYKDAKSLWTLFNQTRQSLENGEEIRPQKQSRLSSTSRKSTSNDTNEGDLSETSTINDDDNVCEDLFSSVTTASIDGRALYPAFRFLPSKKRYPEYYDVIDSPIDLKTIARKIQDGKYGGLVELERDLVLMTRNACSFNEPGSQIYKDAKTLKKIIQTRRQELEQHGRAAPSKTSERIRSKRGSRLNPAPTSADMAALQPDQPEPMDIQSMEEREVERDSEESEAEEEKREVDKDDPQWKLLETVKNVMGPNGQPMSEPFSSLPSRRYYPDYYKQIKNPVSLNQIRNKIKRGDYGTLSEVAGDMNIMFENAKQYNVATSKLYKDAVKLQRIMQQSVQEMLDIVQSSSSDDESLSSVKSQTTPRGRGRRPQQPIASSPALNVSNLGSNLVKNPMPLRKKLHLLQKHMLEATCSDGRQPMLLFMEKPSKKIYPDYYTVIDKPIDMLGIEANIKNERYQSLDEIVADFKLMFSNCRQYNEEGSMIYEDANMLERVLNEKVRDLSGAMVNEKKVQVKVFKAKTKQLTPIEQKLRTLYDAVRDYRDPKANRQLALVFMKLPNKNEYPDYYELIKNPIDMEKIAAKLKNGGYNTVNELASDFVLMFDNACKYNEPDSQIYKDALLLQRVCLQTKQMLREDEDTVPDVGAAVQELLLTLFTTVYNHQDEEGRCYSDSMAELPEHDENAAGEKVRAISLDLIKRRLDKGLYKRLDHFQEDMFVVLDRARRLTRTDSQVFEDSVELQSYFIVTRDQLCKDGAVLHSPALLYDKEMMINAMESVKHSKLLQENTDDDETRSSSDDTMMSVGTDADGAEQPQHLQYSKGDFVYLTPGKGDQASILQVERIWTNADDVAMVHGYCYFRPHETYHVQTRRFLEQEVFKSDAKKSVPLEQISGRCYVMNVKEYFKYQPEGYPDKDVYVCESRYSTRTRSFKKIKVWEGATREPNLRAREPALEPNRSFSVFQQRLEKHRDELAELDHLENVQEKERPDVVMYNPLGSEDENTYYEQYNTVCSGVIKTGDFVYVVTDGGKQMIAQVDTIWETKDNKCYFRGPFLIFPAEVASIINKPFYKQEVLLTTVHDSSPLVGIVGKCSVLYYDDYLKCRPTEIAEADIFVCESLYDESSRVARKLKSGLRHYEHAKDVTVDEIYYFSKPLGPPALASARDVENQVAVVMQQGEAKMAAATHHMIEQKPQFTNLINTTIGSQDVESLLESSLDSSSMASAASLASPATPAPAPAPTPAPTPAPSSSKKRKEPGKKLVTGYILYSSEMRKQIIASHPESTFGDISRIVGNDWRSLPAATKQHWEEKAAQCNEEAAAKLQKELKENGGNLEMIYECGWDSCEYQFEDHSDLTEHCIGEAGGTGHIQAHCTAAVAALPPGATMEYQCLWRSCHRVKRGQAPFPNMQRIVRHVRDLHINKGNGRLIQSQEKSRNYVPSRRKAAASAAAMTALAGLQQGVAGGQGSPCGAVRSTPSPGHAGLGGVGLSGGGDGPRGLDPLFVSAPPRPQRVTHSEAYIRYIEGLHSEQKYITPWEKSIAPTPPNPDPCHYNINKLPSNWLSEEALANYAQSQDKPDGPKPEPNANLVKALWALRDFMMKDAFAINKNL